MQREADLKKLKIFIEQNRDIGVEHLQTIFNWDTQTEERIFYMFCFCLLVPGGRADRVNIFIQELQAMKFFTNETNALTLFYRMKPYVRFPQQKAIRLNSAKESWRGLYRRLKTLLDKNAEPDKVRNFLLTIPGVGMKVASHFMRNIGYGNHAIIDTHILKYRRFFMPEGLHALEPTSEKNYKLLEKYFTEWAIDFDLLPTQLDWFIWSFESKNDVLGFKY